jgi:transketolase
MLPESEQNEIYPESVAGSAMGITGFTMPTMYRWISSSLGRRHSLHPFRKGHFLGSGKAESVIAEAGLDGVSQFRSIVAFAEERGKKP